MVRRRIPLVLVLALTVPLAAQVIDGPRGKVEFLGLERWTLDRFREVLDEKCPGGY